MIQDDEKLRRIDSSMLIILRRIDSSICVQSTDLYSSEKADSAA